jgi:hypothetical protein
VQVGYTHWELPDNEQRLRDAVAESTSIAGVLTALGLVPAGGNYRSVKHHIARLALDTSHHTGQAWNKGNYRERVNSDAARKQQLIRERGHVCERCTGTEWMGEPIPLELEHRDGDHSNNDPANLALLCCNCHAQTPTWRRKK